MMGKNKKKHRHIYNVSDKDAYDEGSRGKSQYQEEWQRSPFEIVLDSGAMESFISKASIKQNCTFPPEAFLEVMDNLIQNPNITSSHLFRADVYYDSDKDFSFYPEAWSSVDRTQAHNNEEFVSSAVQSISSFIEHMRRDLRPKRISVERYELRRVLSRRLVPRNPDLDADLIQTCAFLRSTGSAATDNGHSENEVQTQHSISSQENNLVIYLPHVDRAEDIPWYHPAVKAITFLHEWQEDKGRDKSKSYRGRISIHILPFYEQNQSYDVLLDSKRLNRTLHNLLHKIGRHGLGALAGYQKRSSHDLIVPRAKFQDTFTRLKRKYAKIILREYWSEVTDATKGVFEDLGIAAFLLELWAQIYSQPGVYNSCAQSAHQSEDSLVKNIDNYASGSSITNQKYQTGLKSTSECPDSEKPAFPGFADIGCGNGVLTYILLSEGYHGIGFDARHRKTWQAFPEKIRSRLKPMVLLPALLNELDTDDNVTAPKSAKLSNSNQDQTASIDLQAEADQPGKLNTTEVHDGVFAPGTFIISNHADELIPWTPLLAYISKCPFISIPCCSHDLTGDKYRHPASFLKYQEELVNANHICAKPKSTNGGSTIEPISAVGKKGHEKNVERTECCTSNHNNVRNCESQDHANAQPKSCAPRQQNASGYSTLTAYIVYLTDRLGYDVEKEMLRIPSTRNACIIGRHSKPERDVNRLTTAERYTYIGSLLEQETGKSIGQIRDLWQRRAEKVVREGRGNH